MADDFQVRGAQDLAKLAARLKETGQGELRKELLRGVRGSAKKAIPDIKQSAYRTLPRGGGLADNVARQVYSVLSRYALSGAKVSLLGRGMKELKDIDSGRLRHPVFGNRDVWKQQQVEPGFFTDAISRRAPQIRRDIEKVMQEVARKATRRF